VEGVAGTPAIVLLHAANPPKTVTLAGQQLDDWSWNPDQRLIWIRFGNTSTPRELSIRF